ncbi:MAG: hypothetical protein IJT73_00140 [Selenomonadaceae bacterium]|nr:hypothetical protein [Selenomonadaceae bacterium]
MAKFCPNYGFNLLQHKNKIKNGAVIKTKKFTKPSFNVENHPPNKKGTQDIPVEKNFSSGLISKIEEHKYSAVVIIGLVAALTFDTSTISDFVSKSYPQIFGNSAANVTTQNQPQQNIAEKSTEIEKSIPKPENLLVAPLTSENQKAAVDTLVSFHKNITQKNLRSAYNCLSWEFQNEMEYYGWADGFETTVSSSVDQIKVVSENSYEINLEYVLTAADNIAGRQQIAKFRGTVALINENGAWK